MAARMEKTHRVTGHVFLAKRKRGAKWYAKYRLPDGRQVQKMLGPAWSERGRPPEGHYTRKTAEAELRRLLTDAGRGTLAAASKPTGKTFEDACAEWLRYCEHAKQLAPSTLRDYRNAVECYLKPEFGETPLGELTTERVDAFRERLLDESELSARSVNKLLVQLHARRPEVGQGAVGAADRPGDPGVRSAKPS